MQRNNTHIAYCGFDCASCPIYPSGCSGCKGDGKRLDFCDNGCQIRRCARERACNLCFQECIDYKDCSLFDPIRKKSGSD